MPIGDRDYVRGGHPPACTCADCVLSRLDTGYFRSPARPRRRKRKLLIAAAVSTLLVAVGVGVGLSTEAGKGFYDSTSDRVAETLGFAADEDSPADTNAAPVETDCRTTPAELDQEGQYVHQPIDVVTTNLDIQGDYLRVSGAILDRCKAIWSLHSPDTYVVFAAYAHPKPTCPALAECPAENPVGGVLKPLPLGQYYTDIDAGDVLADDWTLQAHSFEVAFRAAHSWGETFRLGVWGWDVENDRPGLLTEIVVRTE